MDPSGWPEQASGKRPRKQKSLDAVTGQPPRHPRRFFFLIPALISAKLSVDLIVIERNGLSRRVALGGAGRHRRETPEGGREGGKEGGREGEKGVGYSSLGT